MYFHMKCSCQKSFHRVSTHEQRLLTDVAYILIFCRCSTKVDVRDNHVPGEGEFGFCNSACPKQQCKTVSGPKPNTPCIFPFKYNGNTYNFCPIDPEDSTKHWCSTKVDSSGQHVAGSGEYGTCGPDCPVEGNFFS